MKKSKLWRLVGRKYAWSWREETDPLESCLEPLFFFLRQVFFFRRTWSMVSQTKLGVYNCPSLHILRIRNRTKTQDTNFVQKSFNPNARFLILFIFSFFIFIFIFIFFLFLFLIFWFFYFLIFSFLFFFYDFQVILMIKIVLFI